MAADITWTLSGIDTRRWRVQAASLWRPPVSVRSDVLQVPGRHGAVPTGRPPMFDEPTVSLELQPVGDQVALEAAQMELVSVLTAPGLVLGRSSGGVVGEAAARLLSVSPSLFVAGRVARFTVLLAVPGVFLRGLTVDSTLTTSGAVPGLTGSTGPVRDAVLRAKGAQAFSITDDATGTGLSWTGSLPDDWFLYVDAGRLAAWVSQDADAWAEPGSTETRTNLVPNPRYIGPDGMAGGGSASWPQEDVATGGPDGGGWTRVTADAVQTGAVDVGNDALATAAVTEGETYTGSVHMLAETTPRDSFFVYLNWRDSAGNGVGTTNGQTITNPTVDEWQRLSVTGTAPPGAARAQVRARIIDGADPMQAGESVGVAMRLIEKGSVLRAWFDGNSPDTLWSINEWTGTVNASPSAQTITPDVTTGLDFPAAGRLQLWPVPGVDPSVRDASVTFAGASEVVVRAQPAYL